jgi:hypothetical protein
LNLTVGLVAALLGTDAVMIEFVRLKQTVVPHALAIWLVYTFAGKVEVNE